MLSEGSVTFLSIRSATELQRFEHNPSTDEEPVAISRGFRQAGDVKTESENRITSRDSRTPIVESVKIVAGSSTRAFWDTFRPSDSSAYSRNEACLGPVS